MKIEELEQLVNYIEQDDESNLIAYCKEIGITDDFESSSQIYYKIVEQIEASEELLLYFKDNAKKDAKYHVFFPYFQKNENIRFFIDNKGDYKLTNEMINNIEVELKKRQENKRIQLKNKYKKKNEFIQKNGIFFTIILLIISLSCTIEVVEPYVSTHIVKNASITQAKVLEEKRYMSLASHFITYIDIEYEYYVNDIKYINSHRTFLAGISFLDVFNNDEEIKVYYYHNNPSQSKIYRRHNTFIIIDLFIFDIVLFIGILISIKRRKKRKQSIKK